MMLGYDLASIEKDYLNSAEPFPMGSFKVTQTLATKNGVVRGPVTSLINLAAVGQ